MSRNRCPPRSLWAFTNNTHPSFPFSSPVLHAWTALLARMEENGDLFHGFLLPLDGNDLRGKVAILQEKSLPATKPWLIYSICLHFPEWESDLGVMYLSISTVRKHMQDPCIQSFMFYIKARCPFLLGKLSQVLSWGLGTLSFCPDGPFNRNDSGKCCYHTNIWSQPLTDITKDAPRGLGEHRRNMRPESRLGRMESVLAHMQRSPGWEAQERPAGREHRHWEATKWELRRASSLMDLLPSQGLGLYLGKTL